MSSRTQFVRKHFAQPQRYLRKDFGVRVRADIVAAITEGAPFSRVLDAGCGDGRISLTLVERGHRVTFLDSSGEMLRLARAHVATLPEGKAKFIQGMLNALSADRAKFDVILCL